MNIIAKTLRDSAAVVRKKGWVNGIRHSSSGKVCAIGAVESARGLATYEGAEGDCIALQALSCFSKFVSLGHHHNHITATAAWSNALPPATATEDLASAFEDAAYKVEKGFITPTLP